jgi:hypothetical protein
MSKRTHRACCELFLVPLGSALEGAFTSRVILVRCSAGDRRPAPGVGPGLWPHIISAFSMDRSANPLANLAGKTLRQLGDLARGFGLGGDAPDDTPSGQPAPAPVASGGGLNALPDAPVGCTQVAFLPRDPQWAYAFWEIAAADRERAQSSGALQLCLRVEDVTGLPMGAVHPHARQEVVVDPRGSEWFLPIPMAGRDYRVELGYRLVGGGWLSLAVSAVARVPAAGPADLVADRFVPFALEGSVALPGPVEGGAAGVEHEMLYRRAMAGDVLRRRLGSDLLHDQAASAEQGLHASGAGLWASGRSESGSGLQNPRSFWLVADAELIVYGATEPDASLFIGEERVPLSADGTFRVQVPFRDGRQVYPIRAVAADGEQERSICLDFVRTTPVATVNTKEEAQLSWF